MRMELGLSQHQAIKQIQTLSPQMYMSMEILCMNAMDLEDRVETELENNETLEVVEPTPPAEGASVEGAGAEAAEPATDVKDDSFDARFEQWDAYSREEFATGRSVSSYRGEKDEKLEALSNTEGRPLSLQEHLEAQVHLLGDEEIAVIARRCLEVPDRGASAGASLVLAPSAEGSSDLEAPTQAGVPVVDDALIEQVRHVCEDVIYNIDGRGYLMFGPEEIRDAIDPRPLLDVVRIAIEVVQSLEPAGVGGRGLEECLILQLRRDPQDYPLEERIIREHLEDLGHNRLPKIARALGLTIEEVKDAVDNIASLDPLPGKVFGGEVPRYVKPDVLVDEVDGKYEVRVENEYLPRLQVSPHYRNLYRESRKNPEVKKYLKKKMDSAEWLMSAIRQRQSTLQKIAQEIVDIQSEFLDHGISHLKPLKMADVADRLGVHVSTVSRAISGKYMQTPRGIFDLKFFFTGGATKSDGNVEARGSVIQRIKDLIAEEDKQKPLSDISIVRELGKSGIKISRRTVTKYREAENIPSSRERRAY